MRVTSEFHQYKIYPKINTDSADFVKKCDDYPVQGQYTHDWRLCIAHRAGYYGIGCRNSLPIYY